MGPRIRTSPIAASGVRGRAAFGRLPRLTPYVFLAPNLSVFALFLFIPIGAALFISFQQRGILDDGHWIGLQNYADMVRDPLFWQSMAHTLVYTLGTVPTSMAAGLLIAILLNRRLPGRALLRSVYFLPVVVAGVVVALIWSWIFDTTNGVLNGLLGKLHLHPVPWTSSSAWAMPSLIIASVWSRLGFCMVVYLAGLQSVPASLYEAAVVDGTRAWSRFLHITWPLLGPTTFLLLIINVIFSFQVFDLIYVMTGGGPGFSTTVFVQYIYQSAFLQFQMGYASALGVILFLLVLGFTVLQWRLSGQGEVSSVY